MSLQQEIKCWDGKSAIDIKTIYQNHQHDKSFSEKIIQLINQPCFQKAATWLLKHHLEKKHQLTKNQNLKILSLLVKLDCWEAKLHILQCLPYLKIFDESKKDAEAFLRQCLVDKNKFVRAWAYNGFYELSIWHPEYQAETQLFFDMAMKDEAASVKARIRNILKKGF